MKSLYVVPCSDINSVKQVILFFKQRPGSEDI